MATIPEKVGWLFYVAHPNKTTFEHKYQVPNYVNQVIPLFVCFMIIEFIILRLKGKGKRFRLNDGIGSLAHGIAHETARLLSRGVELAGYQWLYERRFIYLDWSSPVTWWTAAILVDFAYYWFHRGTHEIHIAWAAHQIHHSSEDFNLSTALRQPVFQRFFSLGIYQPLALLGVPLPALLVHLQFNLLYQFWIHTELVSNLGPLEWIFNTPSHHRVHHGANKWCLDKNYAGVLIIWDRIFGTFQKERKDEEIVYGLVSQPHSMNPLWMQVYYFQIVFKKAWEMPGLKNKLKALFYGPAWHPGTKRLGDPSELPEEAPVRAKYDPQLPKWMEILLLSHFLVVLLVQQILVAKMMVFSWSTVLLFMIFIFATLISIGSIYDGRTWGPIFETGRCLGFIYYTRCTPLTEISLVDNFLMVYVSISTLFWASQSLNRFFDKSKTVKTD